MKSKTKNKGKGGKGLFPKAVCPDFLPPFSQAQQRSNHLLGLVSFVVSSVRFGLQRRAAMPVWNQKFFGFQ